MPPKKTTAAEILAGWKGDEPCDLHCRLCGNKVANDPPETVWIATVGFTKNTLIEWHEACSAIETALMTDGSRSMLTALFDQLGITDHRRARDVLRLLLARDRL